MLPLLWATDQKRREMSVSQEEYDRVIKTIEDNSCYKFSAGDTSSGAFLIPINKDGTPMAAPFYLPWGKLKKLAELVEKKVVIR